ncbi:MAG: phosphoheptose isomerase [Bacteroidota bacterium]|nr:phosphoheptose isomerase [Bacteroidota bacterium]
MELKLTFNADKKEVFAQVKIFLEKNSFKIINSDETRPWGGFYVIDESQSKKFIDFFLNDVPEANQKTFGKISPKILIVESNKRLSWQYHLRRAEVWKVIAGEVAVVTSQTNKETPLEIKKVEDIIILQQGQRHRLIGTNQWGIVSEIWQHTDINYPSDEEDIVRVQDDFGR